MRRRTSRSHLPLDPKPCPLCPAPHPLGALQAVQFRPNSHSPGGFWCGEARRHDPHSDACAPHKVGEVVGVHAQQGWQARPVCRFRALKTASSGLTSPHAALTLAADAYRHPRPVRSDLLSALSAMICR
jgi:hypothetical protein